MISVIVSHDVDHLFNSDHWFRDLIYPKMWVRTTLQLLRREIEFKEWILRNSSCFKKNRHNLEAQMKYDELHGVKSTFFFGMNQGLGMSYTPLEAEPMIRLVHDRGFLVGVHGIDYQTFDGIQSEHDAFYNLVGFEPCGIRMHYVRFDEETFYKLSRAGYYFDCTDFDKENCGTRKNPYKVEEMWEFPLTIMDGYLPQQFEKAKQETLAVLEECKRNGINYVSVLFHDYQFCDDYKDIRNWYTWLIEYFERSDEYEFISYLDAIARLEGNYDE